MQFALLTIWLAIAASDAAAPQRYRADWELSAQGTLSQTWHVQVDGERIRADLTAYELVGLQLYACPQRGIVRHDLKKIGLVIPYKRRFEEFAYDPAIDLAELDRREGVEALGTETVNGESATRLRATQNGDTITYWVAKTDGVLLKAASTGQPSYSLTVRNLKRGPQPASAFELPQGFTRVDRTAEPANEVANRLLGTLLPSLGSLMQTGQLPTLPAEQRDAIVRECRAVQMPGLLGIVEPPNSDPARNDASRPRLASALHAVPTMEKECAHTDKVNGLCKTCLRREVEELLAKRNPPLPRDRIQALTSEWIRACESPLWPT